MRTIKRELFSVAWKEKILTLRELGFHTHVFMHYAILGDYQMFVRIPIRKQALVCKVFSLLIIVHSISSHI